MGEGETKEDEKPRLVLSKEAGVCVHVRETERQIYVTTEWCELNQRTTKYLRGGN